MIQRNESMHQLICNQHLVLDRPYIQVDIDKLHFDFQQCKLHFLRMMIHRTHCNTCALIYYTIALAGSQYYIRKVHSDIQLSYCMDLPSMVQLGIDILRYDYLTRKLLVVRS